MRQKPWKPNIKFEKENRQKPLMQFQLFIFYETRLFTEKFSRTTTIQPGIFDGRELFKQQSVSVEELSADSCPKETWCSWNKYFYFSSFKTIKFPMGNCQTDSSEIQTLYFLYRSPLNFPVSACLKTENDKNLFIKISNRSETLRCFVFFNGSSSDEIRSIRAINNFICQL